MRTYVCVGGANKNGYKTSEHVCTYVQISDKMCIIKRYKYARFRHSKS